MTQPLATVVTNNDPNSLVTFQTSRLGKPWRISNRGISFLGELESGTFNGTWYGKPVHEGMILKVYNDGKGNPTVGLGHLVVPQDHLTFGDTISVARAKQLAQADFGVAERAINKKVMVPLYQYEFDAIISVVFNAGPGDGLTGLAHAINAGNYEGMPQFIAAYRAGGIEWRRRLEAQLFATGVYNATH